MFTGIIRDTGKIVSIARQGDWRIWISTGLDLIATDLGASICCAGCCLTVIDKRPDPAQGWQFEVQVSAETLSKTVIGGWTEGTQINLEPSLRLGDELGGHFVFGHLDGLATVRAVRAEAESHILEIVPPAALLRYIAVKGSVALDGVSLTVNAVGEDFFTVNIIPHTWDHTTLGNVSAGQQVHIEVDMLARYVARSLEM